MMKLLTKFTIIALVISTMSCSIYENETEDVKDNTAYENFNIPSDFNFATTKVISFNIGDVSDDVSYRFYTFEERYKDITIESVADDGTSEDVTTSVPEDDAFQEIAQIYATGNSTNINLVVPTSTNSIYVQRTGYKVNEIKEIEINGGQPLDIDLNYTEATQSSYRSALYGGTSSLLWGINGEGNLFTLNIDKEVTVTDLDGNNKIDAVDSIQALRAEIGDDDKHVFIEKASLDHGSWTLAIDNDHDALYVISVKSEDSSDDKKLYKYSITYDSNGDPEVDLSEEFIGKMPIKGVRLEYSDGWLYLSSNKSIFIIDPTNGEILKTLAISGLTNSSGGDIALNTTTNKWYVTTFGGLYELTLDDSSFDDLNGVEATRKSADDLPFTPTSLAITPDGNFWGASNQDYSSIFDMDILGNYKDKYRIPFGVNDLTTEVTASELSPDSDKDGVPDDCDDYPDDSSLAYNIEFPSKYGKGSIAFEDLFPVKGDYDFNDLVIDYKYTTVMTPALEVNSILGTLDIVHTTGASYENGFGIQLDGVLRSQVEGVTINYYTEYSEEGSSITKSGDFFSKGIVKQSDGLELDQDHAVIIFFDNSKDFPLGSETITFEIIFNNPIHETDIGVPPFNPFIFVNGDRTREVHLADHPRTDLAAVEGSTFGLSSIDEDTNYKSSNGLPWAISLAHKFKYPIESVSIVNAYNHFVEWAENGGELYEDWYSDEDGYREESKINQNRD